jgi:hypothetical protein
MKITIIRAMAVKIREELEMIEEWLGTGPAAREVEDALPADDV